MNNKKIAFIICTNNNLWFSECVNYLQNLEIPEGYETEVLQIVDAKSMASGYNEGMYSSNAKYKFYLHQDMFIVRTDFVARVIDLFIKNPEIGIMGVLGTNNTISNASYWDHWNLGQVYALDVMRGYKMCMKSSAVTEVSEAVALDGMLLMTQYDIEWREDIFKGWDFYDISQCYEFSKCGYRIAVLHEDEISCLHDCGYSKLARYEENRKLFCQEYGFRYEARNLDGETKEDVCWLEDFLTNINILLQSDIYEACKFIQEVYPYYAKDNRIATLKIISDIYLKEQMNHVQNLFIEINNTWQELIEKYTRYKFLIRRVEFNVSDDSIIKLIAELSEGMVSSLAIAEIIIHSCINGKGVMEKINNQVKSNKLN